MDVPELVREEIDVLVLEDLDVAQVGGLLDRHRTRLDVADPVSGGRGINALGGAGGLRGRCRPALSHPGHSSPR
jgi:hypothetical protein